MNKKLKDAYIRGKNAGTAYLLYRIHRASIALSIALPGLALWLLYEQFSIHKQVGNIHSVYWFTLLTTLLAAVLAYYLAGYANRANTASKQWLSVFAFLGTCILGFSGFVFIGALN